MAKEENKVILFQTQRAFSVLSKNFLNILEDLQEEYDRYFGRGNGFNHSEGQKQMLAPEEFLNDEHFTYLRKKILDKGGEAHRELQTEIAKYNFELIKNEKDQEF